jgi:selenocysteine lyase/cysteine desulfurase
MNPLLSRRALLVALGAATALGPQVAAGQTFPVERVPALPDQLWRWVAAQLVLEPGLVWLDTATLGPTLRAVLVRQYRQLETQSLDPHDYAAAFGTDGPGVRSALESAARFFGADPGELALTHGARAGLAHVAAGLDLQRGDAVLTTELEHPATVYPWLVQARRRGIDVVQLPAADAQTTPDAILQRFEAALGPRTRVLLLSHVREADGAVLPVAELCALARSRGILTVVDGTAAAGQVDVRISGLGCDVYATSLDRWLNGPVDAGLLYVRRETQPLIWPMAPDRADGWDASDRLGQPADAITEPALAAQRRFGADLARRGPVVAAMPLAFEFQDAVVRPRLHQRIRQLAAQFRAGLASIRGIEVLTPAHAALGAGIVAFGVPGRDHEALAETIAHDDRIVLGKVRRGSSYAVLRASLHPANDAIDVDRCLAAIRRRL